MPVSKQSACKLFRRAAGWKADSVFRVLGARGDRFVLVRGGDCRWWGACVRAPSPRSSGVERTDDAVGILCTLRGYLARALTYRRSVACSNA